MGFQANFPSPSIFFLDFFFLLILAYDSIYLILAPGLLFFPPHREARSLVGAYVGDALVFHLAQFSIFDTCDLKLLFFSFRNHKALKSCPMNSKAFSLSKKVHFSQVCLLFCFISGSRESDTLFLEFTSPESRKCELGSNFRPRH